jgi:uncharacterized protein (TIGR03435 family)
MQKTIVGFAWLAFALSVAFGQAQVSFEVASVKPSAARGFSPNLMGMRGGPGTADPGQIAYAGVILKNILLNAYEVDSYQVSGPGWLDQERYDILAKVPSGTTKEQFNAMLRNLLAERFNLTSHHETRELAVYELLVGKNGLKMKEADLNISSEPVPKIGVDKSGCPELPPGHSTMVGRVTDRGSMCLTARMKSIGELAAFLAGPPLRNPVVDRTGLTGKYDFTLEYSQERKSSPGADPLGTVVDAGPNIVDAVQQLGLKLESKKAPIDVLVIDHIDKVPTEN